MESKLVINFFEWDLAQSSQGTKSKNVGFGKESSSVLVSLSIHLLQWVVSGKESCNVLFTAKRAAVFWSPPANVWCNKWDPAKRDAVCQVQKITEEEAVKTFFHKTIFSF
ncbi:hypothetical protein XENTR_v10016267 [Xenopus tropicalis]|nr:hypothetical protein XENTR_v10016267 [Xenopus tropicalis]